MCRLVYVEDGMLRVDLEALAMLRSFSREGGGGGSSRLCLRGGPRGKVHPRLAFMCRLHTREGSNPGSRLHTRAWILRTTPVDFTPVMDQTHGLESTPVDNSYFAISDETEPCTAGIWMSTRPVQYGEHNVLVTDTEGLERSGFLLWYQSLTTHLLESMHYIIGIPPGAVGLSLKLIHFNTCQYE
jgi:hypothetical protein